MKELVAVNDGTRKKSSWASVIDNLNVYRLLEADRLKEMYLESGYWNNNSKVCIGEKVNNMKCNLPNQSNSTLIQ